LEEARNENLSGTNSSIFRYESLDSGQVMSGAILVKDETCSKILQEILYEDVLRLGKSHLTGYGRVRLENLQELDRWKEYELADEDEEEMIIVTLLSDAIIRNEETGAYTSDISPALGTEENNKPIASFARMALRGGFNRTWNLPLPQVHAIVAGSVFVYDKDEKLKKRLQELEISGIGEKKEEGFGRIAINWHREENFEIKSEDVEETGTTIPAEENAHFIGTIAERLLRTELDRLL
jgi:CRISPR-associated protein Csx10